MTVAASFIGGDAWSQALKLSLETIFHRPMIVEYDYVPGVGMTTRTVHLVDLPRLLMS